METTGTITRLLQASNAGDTAASNELFDRVYTELQSIARSLTSDLPAHADLDVTGLIAAACERLLEREQLRAQDRRHFYFLFGRAMHDVIVEDARRATASKRTPKLEALPDQVVTFDKTQHITLRVLAGLLTEFQQVDPQAAMVVRQRFFVRRSLRETAEDLDVSLATVRGDWAYARAWFADRLGQTDEHTR